MAGQTNSFTHTYTHILTYTHMFASMVITTPHGCIILCLVNENNELSIKVKSPIFQCVKRVRIPSFPAGYVTALGWTENGDLSNTDTLYRLFSEF